MIGRQWRAQGILSESFTGWYGEPRRYAPRFFFTRWGAERFARRLEHDNGPGILGGVEILRVPRGTTV